MKFDRSPLGLELYNEGDFADVRQVEGNLEALEAKIGEMRAEIQHLAEVEGDNISLDRRKLVARLQNKLTIQAGLQLKLRELSRTRNP